MTSAINRRLASEFVRRPSPAPRPAPPTESDVRRAREAYAHHIPSMFTYACLGCDEVWPRLYREALVTLRCAGLSPEELGW